MLKKILFFAASVLFMTSCVPLKKTVYLQSENEQTDKEFVLKNHEYRIGTQDILQVSIDIIEESGYLPDQGVTSQATESILYLTGYHQNPKGEISLPLIGNVLVVGKTIHEVKTEIQSEVDRLYQGATVSVRLSGIIVSVLGEAETPGKFIFYQQRVSVLEAIAKAGDLTPVANRERVRIVRHFQNEAKVHFLDLTKEDVISSEYYYLQPNDIVYVEPLEVKTWGIGQEGFPSLVAVLTAVSSTLLIINLLKN